MRYLRLLAVLLFALTATAALADPPVLSSDNPMPAEGQPGEKQLISLTYSQKDGDAPKTLEMIVDTPNGQVKVPPTSTEGADPAQGITVTFTWAPQNLGTYKYQFHAVSVTGQEAYFPPDKNDKVEFSSYSVVVKFVILIAGLALALVFLPFVVYTGTRAVNKRGDPAAAARVGLFIGVLGAYALYWYLFAGIYHTMGLILAAVAAVALLIAVSARR